MTVKLRELIKLVRQCKTAAEERQVITKESSNIRTSFKEEEHQYRNRNMAKLIFMHMLGYPTAFAQMECLKLIVSNSYRDKRMGYLGLMLLLDERQEILMLVTNSLKNDLNHQNQYVVGLALCSLANISSTSIARDLSSDVIKLLSSSNAYIRKKAALCAIRIVRKVPELIDQFIPKVRLLLAERNHGVLITGITLMIEICQVDVANVQAFSKTVPHLVKILKNLVSNNYSPEHDVSGVTDPFLQVSILKLLRLLGKGDTEASDAMNDILAQVATNTENTRNVGNAILYECVQTIMSIESESGLRVLAINILGRFLLNRDNNIRYVALNTLKRVVTLDQQAVQRHRATVVECLKDHDISIRKRALDLTYALVNESNIKILVKELINYLTTADIEFRRDITAQICELTEKYSPNPKWHIDTILKVMTISGNFIEPETVSNTVHLIMDTPDLQAYAVHKLYSALSKDISRQALVKTAVWVIGEFGDLLIVGGKGVTDDNIIDLLENIIKHPSSELETREYVISAFTKLTDRLNDSSATTRITKLIDSYRPSLTLELQQRACEYYALLNLVPEESRVEILDHIPPREVDEEESLRRKKHGGNEEEETEAQQPQQQTPDLLSGLLGPSKPQQPTGDLLSGLLGPSPSPANSSPTPSGGDLLSGLLGPSSPAPVIRANPAPSGGDLLSGLLGPSSPSPAPSGGDLLSGILGTSSPSPVNPLLSLASPAPVQNPAIPANVVQIPPNVVYDKSGIKIAFAYLKQPQTPNVTIINIAITNATPVPLTNFSFLVAVPAYMKMQLSPASGNILPPNNSGQITLQLKIANQAYGQQPTVVRIKLDFVANDKPFSDQAMISNLPAGV